MNVTGHGDWLQKDPNSAHLKLRLQPHDESELERLQRLARGQFQVRAYVQEGCLHMEGIVARRHEIRKARLARLYWQGLQYAWFNPQDLNWHLPFESRLGDDSNLEEMPRYQFVTNYYQGYGLTFISLMSQDTPTV